jgi:hypothetical protein
MAIPFANIIQDGNFPVMTVRCVGVYAHFNDIVFYAPSFYAPYALHARDTDNDEKDGRPLKPERMRVPLSEGHDISRVPRFIPN